MAIKTNKAYLKRIKVTKDGTLLTRKAGQNHFNAKERHGGKTRKHGQSEFHMSNKERSKFLVNFK